MGLPVISDSHRKSLSQSVLAMNAASRAAGISVTPETRRKMAASWSLSCAMIRAADDVQLADLLFALQEGD